MPDYDAIVVGAGLAGSTAAYCLAKAGLGVLMLERGDAPGSKNCSGGRLYAHSLEKIIPGFAQKAPVQRLVTRETISLLTPGSAFSIDFQSRDPGAPRNAVSYTVLRTDFDAWLASEAEGAGCDVVCPARVDSLHMEDGHVAGVVAGEDTLTADIVILADGVNSLLAQQAGLKKELATHSVGVGCKELIELPEQVINDRFGVESGEGVARLFAGDPTMGLVGGGFLYTNKGSVSLGLVLTVHDIATSATRLPDMLDRFKLHPAVAPLIAGGKTVEYGAHLVPEAGMRMLPELVADNLLVAGDAAGMCLNLGYTIRGMDYAVASGELAAKAVIEAHQKGDCSKQGLSAYRTLLEQSIVLKDMKTYANAPAFIENSRTYGLYPEMLEAICLEMFRVNGEPAKRAMKKILPHLRRAGFLNLARDGWKGARAL
jgi:electron transfer flavoprotein-quinone oxidoreductase